MGREKRSKFANDAKTTADLASSLAQKPNITDVRLKSALIEDLDISQDLRNKMTGLTPVNNALPANNSVSVGSLRKSLTSKLNGYRSIMNTGTSHWIRFDSILSGDLVADAPATIKFKVQTLIPVSELVGYIGRDGVGYSYACKITPASGSDTDYEFTYTTTYESNIGGLEGQQVSILAGINSVSAGSDIYVYDVSLTLADGSTTYFKSVPTVTFQGTNDITFSEYSPYLSLVRRGDETVSAPKPLAEEKGYMFGDSQTYGDLGTLDGVQQGRSPKPYPSVVADITGATITNYGDNGATTGRLVGWMTHIKNRDAYSPSTTPDYTNVDFVTIQIGTNGGVTGTIDDIPYEPAKSVDKLPVTIKGTTATTEEQYWALFPNSLYGNVALCIEYVKFKNPKTKIYLITPPHVDRDYWEQNAKVRTALLAIAKLYSVPVIDAQENAGIDKKHLPLFSTDWVHLTTEGNEIWGKYVARQLVAN
jgi:lysophospholipase L1-like esterase